MKAKISFLILLMININIIAQNPIQIPRKESESKGLLKYPNLEKFSSYSKQILKEVVYDSLIYKKRLSKSDSSTLDNFFIKRIGQTLYVSAFIILKSNTIKVPDFDQLKVIVSKKYGKVWLAQIPLSNIEKLGSLAEIEFINISEPTRIELDIVRSSTKSKEVQNGDFLPQKYCGENVVIGIIDGGFDFTHPMYYDSTFTNYRIKRVWDQNATGTPPVGYSYGNEIIGSLNILSKKYDKIDESHGSHVTGIASGGGTGTTGKYKGMAPESDIVLVSQNGGTLESAEAMEYIINYANSVNKPVVINCSWGTRFGARDGLSPLDQVIDALTGEGKIIIKSAGNSGDDKFHLSHSFTATDSVFGTFLKIDGDNKGLVEHKIDIWGSPNSSFKIASAVVNANNSYAIEDFTPYISSKTDNTFDYTLIDEDPLLPDNATIRYKTTSKVTYNLRPNISVDANNTEQDDSYRWIYLEIIAHNTTVHLWGDEGLEFTNLGLSSLGQGDSNYTISEPGNGNSVITVGAYNTTIDPIGGSSTFSSKGPTVDGRIKPEITAPGNRVISSVSRFDNNYLSGGSLWSDVVTGITDGTDTWYFGKMQGTSMAAPVVTGIVALWLEAQPTLSPTQIKQYMTSNSTIDASTGTVPNNTWGFGKIDAHKTITAILNTTSTPKDLIIIPNLSVFPNPSEGLINIKIINTAIDQIEIFDYTGKLLLSERIENSISLKSYNLTEYKNGLYLIKASSKLKFYFEKLIISK